MNKTDKTRVIVYIGLTIAILVLIVMVAKRDRTAQTPDSTELSRTEVTSEDNIKGNPQAEITLIEYSDFQCPACKAYAPIIAELSKLYKQNLRIIYRHFPLTTIHRNAYPASQASEAASLQGKFWEMHDVIFENQSEWSSATDVASIFRGYAERLGLDLDKFTSDYGRSGVIDRVRRDMDTGTALRINSTPSFFLNGEKIENASGLDTFRSLIDPLVGELGANSVNDTYLESQLDEETYFDLAIYTDNIPMKLISSEQSESKYVMMADKSTSVVKLSKSGATLGYALSHFGMNLDNKCLIFGEKTLCSEGGKTLKLFVNGVRNLELENYEIMAGDRILISHGPLTETNLTKQLSSVTSESCTYTNSCE
jgi:protein-disulfide isomerase